VRRFALAVVDFVVGDDVWVAVGIVAAIAATALAVREGFDAWWLLAAGVPLVVGCSLFRAADEFPTRSATLPRVKHE
jgi:hypothetical protein